MYNITEDGVLEKRCMMVRICDVYGYLQYIRSLAIGEVIASDFNQYLDLYHACVSYMC